MEDLGKENKELKAENAKLKAEVESLRQSMQACCSTSETKLQEYQFSPGGASFFTKKELKEVRVASQFKMDASDHCSLKSGEKPATIRLVEFRPHNCSEGYSSPYFNQTYGVYSLPATGRYRFEVKGYFEGSGSTEWFICCDGEDEDDRRPAEFDIDEEYKTYKSEKRMFLYTLTDRENESRIVVLHAERGVNVWLEVYRKDQVEDDEEERRYYNCTFVGAFLD